MYSSWWGKSIYIDVLVACFLRQISRNIFLFETKKALQARVITGWGRKRKQNMGELLEDINGEIERQKEKMEKMKLNLCKITNQMTSYDENYQNQMAAWNKLAVI